MSYAYYGSSNLGSMYASSTITMTVVNASGVTLPTQPTCYIISLGNGVFGIHIPDMPNNQTGWIVLTEGETVLDALLISPTETEPTLLMGIDAKTTNLPPFPASVGSQMVLSATGLDLIPTTGPSGRASTFREMIVQTWRRFFRAALLTPTELITYGDDDVTVITTQSAIVDSGTETQGSS